MTICKLCRVSGQVQGVFYRASTQKKALEYSLTGYAKNLSNGDVEVLACGESQAVEALCDWLWQGPAHARVDAVDCTEAEQNSPDTFKIG